METTLDNQSNYNSTSERISQARTRLLFLLATVAGLLISLTAPAHAVQWGSHGNPGVAGWQGASVNCMYHRIGVPSQYGNIYVGKSPDVGTWGSQFVYAHMIVKRWTSGAWRQYGGSVYLNRTYLGSGLTADSLPPLEGNSVYIPDSGYYQVMVVLDWGEPGTSSYRGTTTLNMDGLTNNGIAVNDYTGQYRGANNYCYF